MADAHTLIRDALERGSRFAIIGYGPAIAALDGLVREREEMRRRIHDLDEAETRESNARLRAERERDEARDALRVAQHWMEQQDYDEALNIIDAALAAPAAPEEKAGL